MGIFSALYSSRSPNELFPWVMSVIAWLQQLSLSSSHDLPAIRGKLRQPMETRLPSLVKPHAVQQVGKAGVLAHGVKQRIYLQVL